MVNWLSHMEHLSYGEKKPPTVDGFILAISVRLVANLKNIYIYISIA